MTGRDIAIAVIFLALGWFLHMLWDEFTRWLYDMTGHVHGFLWDLLAWIGIAAVCLGLGYVVTH